LCYAAAAAASQISSLLGVSDVQTIIVASKRPF